MVKPTVFVHTSSHEILPAKVAMYSLKRMSENAARFDVKLIQLEDYPFLMKRHGQTCIRNQQESAWYKDVPQSFLPLRFMVPQLMGYEGKAVLIDPDIFAVSDIYELLTRDMKGKAIFVCLKSSKKDLELKPSKRGFNSSVMLLDCQKLKHWQWEKQIEQLFAGEIDFQDWISLQMEAKDTIAVLEDEWNHKDKLTSKTRLLHNTSQKTQPWKTGLPYRQENMGNYKKTWKDTTTNLFKYSVLRQKRPTYRKHRDPNQEYLFLSLLKECVDSGFVSRELIESEIKRGHVRPDILNLIEDDLSVEKVMQSIEELIERS